MDKGFSLVELLVAVAVVAMVLVAVVSGISYSIKNTQYSRDKSQATRMASEAIEWSRNLRSGLSWSGLVGAVQADGGTVRYCLPDANLPASEFASLLAGECGVEEKVIDKAGEVTIFSREVEMRLVGAGEIEVKAVVRWLDGGSERVSEASTKLFGWK